MQSARDFCEEYIATRIWPLKRVGVLFVFMIKL
jgi:hypothetical protein